MNGLWRGVGGMKPSQDVGPISSVLSALTGAVLQEIRIMMHFVAISVQSIMSHFGKQMWTQLLGHSSII